LGIAWNFNGFIFLMEILVWKVTCFLTSVEEIGGFWIANLGYLLEKTKLLIIMLLLLKSKEMKNNP
jgi:hypothetical protein